ncbi:nephrin-like isoform X1 [Brevipalpus obovatus]|uniref:nephrin-like isoform X1 n=1 Tax=Brevipalpus obovatus TaxID=246614 RepID=UPI003D9DBC6E
MQREILPKKMRSQFDKNRSHTTTTATVTATLATTSDQVRDQQDQADECRLNSYCTSSSSSSSSSIICENLASHDPQHPIVVVDDHFSNHFISSSSCSSSSSSSSTPSSSQFILLYSSTVHHYQRFFKFCALLLVTNLLTHVCLPDNILPAAMAITTHNSDSSGFGQQYFRVSPADHVEVIEGSTIIIQCSIGNQAGPVQWAKDGFVLGFNRSIPGYPRLSMVGNPNDGVHNLKVENAQLEDDGMYQCQVGPSGTSKSIRADSKLTVLLKPKSIDIIGQVNGRTMNGSEVRVQQGEKVTLQCIVRGGKPAALIRWYRKDVELRLANLPNQSSTPTSATSDSNYGDGQLGSVVKSEISLVLQPEDNGISYTCSAVHTALSKPLRKTVTISVLYPPGPPEIIGYRTGEILRAGDILTMTCKSRGGNPLARLTWFKNNEQVDSSFKTYHDREESINEHTITIDSSHNNAAYKCEATSDYISKPMFASVKMSVQFAPTKVTIKGPKEARAGDNVTLTCRSDPSNPASEINWVVDGRSMFTSNSNKSHPNGGYITSANVTLPITSTDRNMKTFSCFAVNRALGETVLATHTLNILYPPYKPSIIGYDNLTAIRSGTLKRLTCESQGGNPFATLKWFKESEEIMSGFTRTTTSGASISELSVLVKYSDNGAAYRCEASNPVTSRPLNATIRFNVYFAPSKVSIKSTPGRPKSGSSVNLTCESASSNPPAEIVWKRNGLQLINTHESIVNSSYRGKSTRAVVRLNVTTEDDGSIFICQATNKIMQQSVHDAFTLSVRYKPEFINDPMSIIELTEGKSASINITAKGNPSNISYRWSKLDGPRSDMDSLRFIKNGSFLEIANVSRIDSGTYRLEASNTQGTTKTTFKINVNYPAIIIKTSDLVLEDVGRTAYLECRVDANPITKDMIKWYRREPSYHSDYAAATSGLLSGSRSTMIDHHPIDEFDQNRIDSGSSSSTPTMTTIHTIPLDSGRLKQTFEENRSFLIIHNVTQNDSGAYECEAYNGIGSKSIAVANFIVKHKPRIINPPILSKSASDHGSIGRLICRAQGAPNVTFQWMREGSILSTDNPLMGTKYRLESTVKLDLITYQSILYINSVSSSDYGSYDCVARNELGLETRSIEFNRTSKPDTPLALRVVNRTSSWITLKWIPGFDGGLQQSFRIRYQKYDGVVDDDSSTISFPSSSSGVDDFESSSSSSSSSSSMPVTSFTAAAVSHYPYMYTDVYPKNSTQFIVKGLQDDQEYIFSIMAYNELGNSAFTDDLIKAKTLKEAPVSEKERISQVLSAKAADLPRLIIIAVSVLGSSLLLLNVVLVACFVRKRRKKRLEEAEADGSSTAKAATIEMYAPASGSGGSYNNGITETSVSGSDEENKSEAAYSGQMDYAMEISATDGVSGNQANIRTNVHHGLSTYLIEDTLPHLNTFYQPHGYPNYVNPVGPDVTVNTYFMDDPHYVDAIRKNSYNQHFENTVNLVSPQTQLTDKPMSDNIKPNGIPPIPPLRSTDLSTFLPMITEEPMLINNGQLGHLV